MMVARTYMIYSLNLLFYSRRMATLPGFEVRPRVESLGSATRQNGSKELLTKSTFVRSCQSPGDAEQARHGRAEQGHCGDDNCCDPNQKQCVFDRGCAEV